MEDNEVEGGEPEEMAQLLRALAALAVALVSISSTHIGTGHAQRTYMHVYMKYSSKVESNKEIPAASPLQGTHTCMNTGTGVHEHKHIFKYLILMCMSVQHACMRTMCMQYSEVRRGHHMP